MRAAEPPPPSRTRANLTKTNVVASAVSAEIPVAIPRAGVRWDRRTLQMPCDDPCSAVVPDDSSKFRHDPYLFLGCRFGIQRQRQSGRGESFRSLELWLEKNSNRQILSGT